MNYTHQVRVHWRFWLIIRPAAKCCRCDAMLHMKLLPSSYRRDDVIQYSKQHHHHSGSAWMYIGANHSFHRLFSSAVRVLLFIFVVIKWCGNRLMRLRNNKTESHQQKNQQQSEKKRTAERENWCAFICVIISFPKLFCATACEIIYFSGLIWDA